MIGDIDPAGSETVEAIKRDAREAIFMRTDVSNEGDVKNLIATAVKTYGAVHCAFNNAGVLPPTVKLVEMDESTFDRTLAVDLKGVFLLHEVRDRAHAAKRRRRNREQRVNRRLGRGAWNQRLYRRQTWRYGIVQSGYRRIRKSG